MQGKQQKVQIQQKKPQVKSPNQKLKPKLSKCAHYMRQCKKFRNVGHVEAPCCKIFYSCKLCHDDKFEYKKGCQVQRMAFEKVQNIKCLKCQLIQTPSQICENQNCRVKFGQYTCLKCMLYQNNPKKKIFHCEQCFMCRLGNKQDFFHCQKCGYCRPISQQNKHKCNQNVALSQCPICLQVLKYSTKPYIGLSCGHLIHKKCMKNLLNINCPVCGMAIQKMSQLQNQYIQKAIDDTKDKLPQQVKDHKVDVLCNQCLHKTMQAQFHFYGIKCQKCGTFNTKMI